MYSTTLLAELFTFTCITFYFVFCICTAQCFYFGCAEMRMIMYAERAQLDTLNIS